eukprot:3515003-Pleurochrysis_carterae.AAC.1
MVFIIRSNRHHVKYSCQSDASDRVAGIFHISLRQCLRIAVVVPSCDAPWGGVTIANLYNYGV